MCRDDVSLLECLREDLGARSVKDGCSPQGQCGCCTVLVDGNPRVACVTPVRRIAGCSVTTVDGLPEPTADRLVRSLLGRAASQCGFCTPGIICRLSALRPEPSAAQVETALLAHLCRCTGWRSIVEAVAGPATLTGPAGADAAARRAELEGGVGQQVGAGAALGRGGFADDTAPLGCLVAVPKASAGPEDLVSIEGWSVGATLDEARSGAGKVQGRRSGQDLTHPVGVPRGEWDLTLQTTWVEPAYLEPDASWCEPGGTPASPVANGGAFGAKTASPAPVAARLLADRLERPVRVLFSREDVVRFGPKRPPVGAGIRGDGTGVMYVGISPHPGQPGVGAVDLGFDPGVDLGARAHDGCPGLLVETVPVTGPPVSASLRGAAWAEAAVLGAAVEHLAGDALTAVVRTAEGARAEASVELDAAGWPIRVQVEVDAGEPLDEAVLRSYVQGAAHMALGWVCSEGIAVDEEGRPTDLTIRSFGILRAKDTPPIEVVVAAGRGRPPCRVSDAVFAAVAAATWLVQGLPSRWPTRRGTRR